MIALRAYRFSVFLCRTSKTLPAQPFPSTRIISKSSTTTFFADFAPFLDLLLRSTDFERFDLGFGSDVDTDESSSAVVVLFASSISVSAIASLSYSTADSSPSCFAVDD